MDLALAWALYLAGKIDQEKFKALNWGLRQQIIFYHLPKMPALPNLINTGFPPFNSNWCRFRSGL